MFRSGCSELSLVSVSGLYSVSTVRERFGIKENPVCQVPEDALIPGGPKGQYSSLGELQVFLLAGRA